MNRVIIIIAALTACILQAVGADNRNQTGATPSRPTLFVAVTVNGLDYDRLVDLLPYMGGDGFKRLMSNGVTLTDVEFGSGVDDAAATAILFTGASPAVNGITASERFDPESRRVVSVLHDASQMGNYTDETLSPGAVRVSTLGDEVRIDANGLGNVYAIAPDPAQAIISAGHAANSAAWITDTSGKWATTTYYKDLPMPLQTVNHRRPLYVRLDTLIWGSALGESVLKQLPSYKRIYQFRHSFGHNDKDRYRAFKQSAMVNAEVTDMAIDYIRQMSMGSREPIDMLALTYTLQPYLYGRDPDNRAETIDAYLRLDGQLARLIQSIESNGPGMANTFVVLAGTPVQSTSVSDDPKWGVPTGTFSPDRAMSLLKVYLMSLYGNGDWVTGYHDRQFFLNQRAIKDRSLNVEDVAAEAASFLRRMSGVTYAATLREVLSGVHDDAIFAPTRNIDADTAGDVFIAVAPGWTIEDTGASRVVATRAGTTASAAVISAPGLKPSVIDHSVDARRIAPTVSRLLRVRRPAGASMPSLKL